MEARGSRRDSDCQTLSRHLSSTEAPEPPRRVRYDGAIVGYCKRLRERRFHSDFFHISRNC